MQHRVANDMLANCCGLVIGAIQGVDRDLCTSYRPAEPGNTLTGQRGGTQFQREIGILRVEPLWFTYPRRSPVERIAIDTPFPNDHDPVLTASTGPLSPDSVRLVATLFSLLSYPWVPMLNLVCSKSKVWGSQRGTEHR
jgi:hypothetical protein